MLLFKNCHLATEHGFEKRCKIGGAVWFEVLSSRTQAFGHGRFAISSVDFYLNDLTPKELH